MDYNDALEYLSSIPWTSRKVGLHRMKALLKELGNPDKKLKFVHVAGTNGKGSVCAMLDAVLRAQGMRTGLFTSPHLNRYNERMRINGCEIRDEVFSEMIHRTAKAAEKIEDPPSEFEILTAAGILWFKEEKCDIVILEVGLGGEFDSTNVIKEKELAVITPIGFDHTAILGNTLEEISSAKAGIITKGCDVVCSLQNRDGLIGNEYPLKEKLQNEMKILQVISSKCLEKRARLHIPDTLGFKLLSKSVDGQTFLSRYYKDPLQLSLIGEYQLQNALTVLEAVKVLNGRGYDISEKAVIEGLRSVKWAARFEVLCRQPLFILDGAHNEHGIDAAVDALRWLFDDRKIIYILGVLSDKNTEAMLLKLYTNAKSFITLTPDSERALNGEKLAERLRNAGFEAVNFGDISEAVEYAKKIAGSEEDVICSLGSLYLAGTVRECFRAEKS